VRPWPSVAERGRFESVWQWDPTNDNPSPNADWASAREAYTAAAALGSYAPETFRHLAITYEHFGDHADAVAPARHAVELDRFDPVSQALLTKLTGH
jgi:hypothetical protein